MSTQFVPWNSISESLVDYGQRRLHYPEGLASPCVTCRSAPCCTHLRVQTFRATKLMELDLARYLLNFERIELGTSRHPQRRDQQATVSCGRGEGSMKATVQLDALPCETCVRRHGGRGERVV